MYSASGLVEIYNSSFRWNSVSHWKVYGPSYSYGGGIMLNTGSLFAVNSIFANNSASGSDGQSGGGLYVAAAVTPATLVNCTIASNNIAGLASGAKATVMNSILFFNDNNRTQITGSTNVTHCDVQNGYPGLGNIDSNPVFALDSPICCLMITYPSKCIDAGNPDPAYNDGCFPPSLGGMRNDMGAHGGPGNCDPDSGSCPKIMAQPRSQSGCLGQSVTFSVGAVGSPPLSYQWWFGSSLLPGQTNASLTLTNLLATDAGPYAVVVSNPWGSTNSSSAQLVVNDACVNICMYAGLTITGQPGATYVLKYTTDLGVKDFADWIPLATNTMPSTGWFYLDTGSCGSPRRFYGVKLVR